jgi:hypothetical protein
LRSRVQRRGTHVNTPEIGSRDGGKCFGGILEFYAELPREFGGEFKVGNFWVFGRCSHVGRWGGGGTNGVYWGNLIGVWSEVGIWMEVLRCGGGLR